ncbi:luciferase-like monooxygenase family protein [Mycobacterium kansasii]|uniref:Luciferase-like monooxygenase family protein n=1 Tax=Mycobacterium kansasii TaxID=1768 RepID=A0A1V3XB64_MYCKA|nr:luciferase-like monooxygenase family protein [Mycobacterium kansasii]
MLANMAAALDIISNGRLELGIGAGWNEEESGAYGIELGTIKERFDRFEEACAVLTGLLSQETTNFDGKYYQLKDARNEPKGPQRPHPPICIGGSGEKRTLRITARYAQHWNFVGGPPEEFARKRDVLAAHCADIGRDPDEITCSAHLRLDPERNYQQVVDAAAALAPEGLDLGIVYIAPPTTPRSSSRWRRRSGNRGCFRNPGPDNNSISLSKLVAPERATSWRSHREAEQLFGGDQTLVPGGKLVTLYRVTKPRPGDSPHP